MAILDSYSYPSAEAQFNLYNFHSQGQVDDLVDVLDSRDGKSPRIIQLFGEHGSGRHYLLRAAAYHAQYRGTRISVEELSMDGYAWIIAWATCFGGLCSLEIERGHS